MEPFTETDLIYELVEAVIDLAKRFKEEKGRIPVFMEVCGSHTMALTKTGIKARLRDYIHLISGPGCPVCVTDQKSIDAMIQLSEEPNTILCTFGDMMRVPGSKSTLMEEKTSGKDIRVIYSPLDSIKIAEENPEKEVVFLGIGFETTIPILALTIRQAERKNIKNYSIWMTTKLIEPVLSTMLQSGEVKVDGFLLPGHVAVVTGKQSYHFLVEKFAISGVITGFEPIELLSGIYKLIQLHLEKKVDVLNEYTHVVSDKGNIVAQKLIEEYLETDDVEWRGIGVIHESGLVLKGQYAQYDAKRKFNIPLGEPTQTNCRCGEVVQGLIAPEACRFFNNGCTPTQPLGPCMVSSEGTCAAHYQFMKEVSP